MRYCEMELIPKIGYNMDCSLKLGYINKELLVIVNHQRHGEFNLSQVLTTRQALKGVCAISLVYCESFL